MLAAERRNEILEKLQTDKKVVVSELSRHYNVSEETIRRDLEKLEKDGYAVKGYGGAIINESMNIDLPFNVRKKHNVEGKQKIAEMVATLVEDGEHIMLDASSTAVFIAKALKKKERLTVVTNSIEVIIELSDMPEWNILSSGGRLKEGYLALVGPKAVTGINSYNVEKAIISCKGFHAEKGFSDTLEEFAQTKQTMLHCGKKCILAADYSKFGKFGFARVGDLKDIDVIVTDQKPDEEVLQLLAQAKVECLYPDE